MVAYVSMDGGYREQSRDELSRPSGKGGTYANAHLSRITPTRITCTESPQAVARAHFTDHNHWRYAHRSPQGLLHGATLTNLELRARVVGLFQPDGGEVVNGAILALG